MSKEIKVIHGRKKTSSKKKKWAMKCCQSLKRQIKGIRNELIQYAGDSETMGISANNLSSIGVIAIHK